MNKIYRIDGIKWLLATSSPIPLCPDHDLRLTPIIDPSDNRIRGRLDNTKKLRCAEGHIVNIPRQLSEEKQYVIDRINAKKFAQMEVVDLDGELTPLAKEEVSSEDNKFFITAHLRKSKRGLQLVLYAGEKGKSDKTQIFVEPEIKRLAFDQKNLNPEEVFVELKAIFDDGSSHTITKNKK